MTSSRDSDPLLRAVATGDANCPDGQALARLGRLIRGEAAVPGDLRERIAQRLATEEAEVTTDDGERIDRHFDREQPQPDLERLGDLVGLLRPAPADLRDRVRRQLKASLRLAPVTAEAPVSTRAQAASRRAEHGRLFRIVLGIAAVLVVGVMLAQHRPQPAPSDDGGWITAKPQQPPLPEALPEDWNQLRGAGFDLFALRRTPELRAAARTRFGMERSANAVACGLRWLLAQQTADGTFGASVSTGSVSTANGTDDAATARQALATLALLGEGGGPTTTDQERLAAAGRGLTALHVAPTCGPVPRSLAALARVEGALLGVGEPVAAKAAAEAALADLAAHLPSDPGAAGLGGFALLAVETARQADLAVPPRLLEHSRNTLGRQLPAGDQDPGRLGLAAFARLVLGYRQNPSTTTLIEALDAHRPTTEANDALGWFFATLALREVGGPAWDSWNAALQTSLVGSFTDAGPGQARVPMGAVRHAPDELFATAIAVLDLQAAYRYLPTAH